MSNTDDTRKEDGPTVTDALAKAAADREMTCSTCGPTPHRFHPSPGPHWRCSECGEAPTVEDGTFKTEHLGHPIAPGVLRHNAYSAGWEHGASDFRPDSAYWQRMTDLGLREVYGRGRCDGTTARGLAWEHARALRGDSVRTDTLPAAPETPTDRERRERAYDDWCDAGGLSKAIETEPPDAHEPAVWHAAAEAEALHCAGERDAWRDEASEAKRRHVADVRDYEVRVDDLRTELAEARKRLEITREALLRLSELVAGAIGDRDTTPRIDAFMEWAMAIYQWNTDEIEHACKRWKALLEFEPGPTEGSGK